VKTTAELWSIASSLDFPTLVQTTEKKH